MNAHAIETLIAQALSLHTEALNDDACADVPEGIEDVAGIQTFAEAGLLTTDAGLVLHLADGSEWQVTIVRSR